MNTVVPISSESSRGESLSLKHLNQRTDKLISVFSVLKSLLELRAQSNYCTNLKQKQKGPVDSVMTELLASVDPHLLEEIKEELNELFGIQLEQGNKEVIGRLRVIDSDLNLMQEKMNGLFGDSIIPILAREKLVSILVSKIKYSEYVNEANVNCEVIEEIFRSINRIAGIENSNTGDTADKLDFELLKLDILDSRIKSIIGAMRMIEFRRLQLEELADKDRKRRNRTTRMVTAYIILVTLAIICTPIMFFQGTNFQSIKFLGIIPLSVMIWSFIGSFAATIHRFNRRKIYKFSDVWKWMITRHAQGIILSSAFYLVLISGLFLISGGSDGDPSRIKNEVILILSFLIGFSDRFVDSVFNTLLKRYTNGMGSSETDSKDSQSK
ncbi:hypothetical protein [Leptothermofonsia sp. ETS-13]|uniref:hypothetical protein n=1 Tax=Leptothermofonsia sp. ETS-13 TaxID=3035696 RepID=UPI003BA13B1E